MRLPRTRGSDENVTILSRQNSAIFGCRLWHRLNRRNPAWCKFRDPTDGLDISSWSLKAAKNRVYRTLLQGDFQHLFFKIADGSYDALTYIGVLTYVPDNRDFGDEDKGDLYICLSHLG